MVKRRLSALREDARTDILRCRFDGDLFRGCGGGAERKKLTDAALCAEGLVVFASDFHSVLTKLFHAAVNARYVATRGDDGGRR